MNLNREHQKMNQRMSNKKIFLRSSPICSLSIAKNITFDLLLIRGQNNMNINADKLPNSFNQLAKIHTGPIYAAKFNNQGEYCMTGS